MIDSLSQHGWYSMVGARMESQMGTAFYVGLTVFAISLVGSLVSLALLLSSPGKARVPSRLLIAAGLGLGGFLVGTWLGIEYFCSPGNAGNLCGLGGFLGTGPFLSGLGLIIGAVLMLKARDRAP
ncbi:MAG TPA: hypothetical protein VFI26_04945 [Lysobacter sp.]|nr:hypothetical protein [Lysobacter sp.]